MIRDKKPVTLFGYLHEAVYVKVDLLFHRVQRTTRSEPGYLLLIVGVGCLEGIL